MKNKPSIIKNYIYNLSYTILNSALPLITAPYVSRVLGSDGIGAYSFYYAKAHIFYIVAKLGLNNYGTRKIAQAKAKGELSYTFSSIYYQQLITAILSNILYFVYFNISTTNVNTKIYALYIWPIVLGSFFDIDWFYSGIENFEIITKKNTIVKLLSIFLVFIFVKEKSDTWLYILIMALSMFFGYLSMWTNIKKYIEFTKVSIKDVFSNIKPNLLLSISVFSVNIYRQADKIMLGELCNLSEVGIYENAEKVIYTLCGFISSFGTVMMPRISNMAVTGENDKNIKYLYNSIKFMMFLMIPMMFGLLATSDLIVKVLFGEEFLGSIKLLKVLSLTLPIIGWANVIRTQCVIPYNRDDILVKSVTIGAVLDVIANIVLIPSLKSNGAVIATLIAEGSVPITQFILLRKDINYRNIISKIISPIIFGGIMFVFLLILRKLLVINSLHIELFISVLTGLLVYGLCCLVYFTKLQQSKNSQ